MQEPLARQANLPGEEGSRMAWGVLAVAFAGIWVYALYREDLKNPEPVWLVLLATGAGMLALPAAEWIEARLVPDLSLLEGSLAQRAGVAFLVSGPVEEGLKYLGVYLLVWTGCFGLLGRHFDEPVDGLVYAAAAGAGFALVENFRFMEDQPEVALARGPAATAAHVLFAALWGGALGHAGSVAGWGRRVGIAAFGLMVAALAHGAFNLVTFSVDRELTLAQGRTAQIALLVACLFFLRWRLRAALRQAPFRYRVA